MQVAGMVQVVHFQSHVVVIFVDNHLVSFIVLFGKVLVLIFFLDIWRRTHLVHVAHQNIVPQMSSTTASVGSALVPTVVAAPVQTTRSHGFVVGVAFVACSAIVSVSCIELGQFPSQQFVRALLLSSQLFLLSRYFLCFLFSGFLLSLELRGFADAGSCVCITHRVSLVQNGFSSTTRNGFLGTLNLR